MVVDRGSLEYGIHIPDEFSRTTQLFRRELEQSRQAWIRFRQELQSAANITREVGRARAEIRRATTEARNSQTALSRSVLVELTNTQRLVSAREDLLAARELENELATATTAQNQARLASERAITTEVRRRAGLLRNQRESGGSTRALNQELALQRSLNDARAQFNRLIGTADPNLLQAQRSQDAISASIVEQNRVLGEKTGRLQSILTLLQAELRALRSITAELLDQARIRGPLPGASTAAPGTTPAAGGAGGAQAPPATAQAGGAPSEESINRSRRGLRALGEEASATQRRVSRLFFTFRRLFGVLAAFQAARVFVNGLRQAVAEAFRFNAAIETATTGIASLFLAVGQVRDAFGGSVEAAEAFAIAQRQARRQTDLLRRDAVATTATFEQLLDTFQIAIAPGLRAGLDVDEIRRLTRQLSQAATAIGLPQNQLAEEIRSLLSGTIQARTTRIATALGITNEDIRNAREAGALAEFLERRFSAFNTAGEQAAQTFSGLAQRLTGVFQEIIAAANIDAFVTLRASFKSILDDLTEIREGEVIINPRAIEIVNLLSAGIEETVKQFDILRNSFNFEDLRNTADLIGRTSATFVTIIANAFEGFVNVINGVSALFLEIEQQVVAVAQAFNFTLPENSFRTVLGIVAGIVAQFLTMRLVVSTVVVFVTKLAGSLFGIRPALVAVTASLNAISVLLFQQILPAASALLARVIALSTPILLVGAALTLVVALFKELFSALTGRDVSFLQTVRLLLEGIGFVIKSVSVGLETVFAVLKNLFTGTALALIDIFQGILEVLKTVIGFISADGSDALDKLIKKLETVKTLLPNGEDFAAGVDADFSKILDDFTLNKLQTEANIAVILKSDPDPSVFIDGILRDLSNAVGIDIAGFFNKTFSFEQPQEEARRFVDILKEVEGTVSQSNQSFEVSSEILKQVSDRAQEAKDELEVASRSFSLAGSGGISQAAGQQIRLVAQAAREGREATLQLVRDEEAAIKRLQKASQDRSLVELAISKTSEEQRKAIEETLVAIEEQSQARRTIAQLEQRALDNTTLRKVAEERLDTAREASLREQGTAIQEQLLLERTSLEVIEARISAIDNSLTLSREERQVVDDLLRRRIQASAQERSVEDQIAVIKRSRLELEQQINNVLNTRITSASLTELGRLERENAEKLRSILLEQQLQTLKAAGVDGDVFESAAAQLEADAIRERISLLQLESVAANEPIELRIESLTKEVAILDSQISKARQRKESEESIATSVEQREIAVRALAAQEQLLAAQTIEGLLTVEELQRRLFEQELRSRLANNVNTGDEVRIQQLRDEIEAERIANEERRRRLQIEQELNAFDRQNPEAGESDNRRVLALQAELNLIDQQIAARERLAEIEARTAENAAAAARDALQRAQVEEQSAIARREEQVVLDSLEQNRVLRQTELEIAEQRISNIRQTSTLQQLSLEQQRLQIQDQLEQAQLRVSDPFEAAFTTFQERLQERVTIPYETVLNQLESAFSNFNATASAALVSVFDPGSGQSARQLFASFFRQQAQQLLQVAISAITANLIGTLIPGVAALLVTGDIEAIARLKAFFSTLTSVGRAEGGPIPKKGLPSVYHYQNPQGLTSGGSPKPPKGISRKDTTPIWAEPGEFMMKVKAVQKYGTGFMEAVNEGRYDTTQRTAVVLNEVRQYLTREEFSSFARSLLRQKSATSDSSFMKLVNTMLRSVEQIHTQRAAAESQSTWNQIEKLVQTVSSNERVAKVLEQFHKSTNSDTVTDFSSYRTQLQEFLTSVRETDIAKILESTTQSISTESVQRATTKVSDSFRKLSKLIDNFTGVRSTKLSEFASSHSTSSNKSTKVVGYAAGGSILSPGHYGIKAKPPKGISRKDTVPLWAEPGEFMLRAKAVQKYGVRWLRMLNSGAIDPTTLPRMASLVSVSRNITQGYQSGGLVSDSVLDSITPAASGREASQQQGILDSSLPNTSVIIGDDRAMERMIAGGRRAFDENFRENSEVYNDLLRGQES